MFLLFYCRHVCAPPKVTNMASTYKGIGRTREKFSSLPAKKPQKLETATGKENF